MHNGKNWNAITELLPGRTKVQCSNRWHNSLNHSIDKQATRRTDAWTKDEDSKLNCAIQMYGDKDWSLVAALVPGRTKSQFE
jgi:myb proto-oncogene protein